MRASNCYVERTIVLPQTPLSCAVRAVGPLAPSSPPSSPSSRTPPQDTPLPSTSPKFSSSRKRRLSDADGERVTKRSRGISSEPRSYIGADPMPSSQISHALEPYIFGDFSSPPLISMDQIDNSAPLDISLFDWNAFNAAYAEPVDPQSMPRKSLASMYSSS